jgi:hypothetical protein
MNEWKKAVLMSTASVAVFILAGCGQASARVQAVQPRPVAAVAVSDTQPRADADNDNGPGCAESALNDGPLAAHR